MNESSELIPLSLLRLETKFGASEVHQFSIYSFIFKSQRNTASYPLVVLYNQQYTDKQRSKQLAEYNHPQAGAHLDADLQLAHGGGRHRGRHPLLRQRRNECRGETQGGRQLLDSLV